MVTDETLKCRTSRVETAAGAGLTKWARGRRVEAAAATTAMLRDKWSRWGALLRARPAARQQNWRGTAMPRKRKREREKEHLRFSRSFFSPLAGSYLLFTPKLACVCFISSFIREKEHRTTRLHFGPPTSSFGRNRVTSSPCQNDTVRLTLEVNYHATM